MSTTSRSSQVSFRSIRNTSCTVASPYNSIKTYYQTRLLAEEPLAWDRAPRLDDIDPSYPGIENSPSTGLLLRATCYHYAHYGTWMYMTWLPVPVEPGLGWLVAAYGGKCEAKCPRVPCAREG